MKFALNNPTAPSGFAGVVCKRFNFPVVPFVAMAHTITIVADITT